jgi:phage/plasmid-like protein (TIGR03299 family)
MAHDIETYDDQAAAIFARLDPWHRLGTTVRGEAFTAEEAMRIGHLGDWNVRKAPMTAADITDDGVDRIDVPRFYATVRTNPFTGQPEALGVVGSGYTPLQNEEHAEFLNLLADESGAIFDTAGSLGGGRQVFITMQLPKTFTVGGTDRIDLYIAALNSHDGSTAFRTIVTPIRVVCANTQSAALRHHHHASFSIRHTRNAKAAVEAARNALGLTFSYAEAFETEAEQMIQTTLTDAAFDELISNLFGDADATTSTRGRATDRQRRHRLHWLFADADTQADIRGTAWAGYQAVAEYIDHYAGPHQGRRDHRPSDPAARQRRTRPTQAPGLVRPRLRLTRSLRWRAADPASGPPPEATSRNST